MSEQLYINFGDFLCQKRQAAHMTMRELGEALDCSAPYISDVEKGNRNPFSLDRLEKLIALLNLTVEESHIMYNLVSKQMNMAPPDLTEYILNRDYVMNALRLARDLNIDERDWQKFMADLKSHQELREPAM